MTAKKFEILVLNQISQVGLKRLPEKAYKVSKDAAHPDAILVRSHDMNSMKIPDSVRAIGRAGAGTNNIPVNAMSERGVPVFNAPGANANAEGAGARRDADGRPQSGSGRPVRGLA